MIKLFNTLTRKKEEFKPIKTKEVGIYSCGLTVYNYGHIGNFRAFVFADLLHRYFEYKGFKVKHITNITDVDDKTIRDSQKEKLSLKQFTSKYEKAFFEDIKTLNIKESFKYPKATEHIKEMVSIIKKLLDKGYAYKTDDGIYFKISKDKEYGKLAHLKFADLEAGASERVTKDEYDKENVQDFCLWKFYDKLDGDVFWDTEIGKGRPGWHIECSAMSMKYLGETFDIHTGGIDLIFPHHENEIAQSECATGKKFVNYWLHNEFILVDGKKMSKSLGNFYTYRDVLAKGYSGMEIRYSLLSTHYRIPFNFTFEGLDSARNSLKRLNEFVNRLNFVKSDKDSKKVSDLIKNVKKEFEESLDDDLNIANALASIFGFISEINKLKISKKEAKEILKTLNEFDQVLGLNLISKKESIPKEIKELMDKREKYRKEKDWKKADEIRDKLKEKGFVLEDTKEGIIWKKA
ncbi:MAG: cysteine--tRNA ligase [Candidatus Nanoarchaeia archaeon]|nr:cysteine--tRNA ligase [Candidatus Nanoarchaeia archaeon]MDD5587688.1 cysteine--tRNA ligase [Candidatus Nanoarchaeia archaeon]